MRFSLLIVVALFASLIVGCGQSLESKLPGSYTMEIDTSAMKDADKAMADMAKGFMSQATLELTSGKVAKISGMGAAQEGTWSLDGTKLTIKNKDPKAGEDMFFTVSSDGGTLTAIEPEGSKGEMKGMKLMFKKSAKK